MLNDSGESGHSCPVSDLRENAFRFSPLRIMFAVGLEKEMVTHSSILAWKISWTGEPGRLQSMESDTPERLHLLSLNIYGLYYAKVEKAMAPHSSTLAWKIPWTEEPGGLQSMGSLRVGHG